MQDCYILLARRAMLPFHLLERGSLNLVGMEQRLKVRTIFQFCKGGIRPYRCREKLWRNRFEPSHRSLRVMVERTCFGRR